MSFMKSSLLLFCLIFSSALFAAREVKCRIIYGDKQEIFELKTRPEIVPGVDEDTPFEVSAGHDLSNILGKSWKIFLEHYIPGSRVTLWLTTRDGMFDSLGSVGEVFRINYDESAAHAQVIIMDSMLFDEKLNIGCINNKRIGEIRPEHTVYISERSVPINGYLSTYKDGVKNFFEFASKQYLPCHPILRRNNEKGCVLSEKLKVF